MSDTPEDDCLHVMPRGDVVNHEFVNCPCGPTDEPVKRADGSIGWMAVHHSLDGRESREREKSS